MIPYIELAVVYGPKLVTALVNAWKNTKTTETLEDWLGGFAEARDISEIYRRKAEDMRARGLFPDEAVLREVLGEAPRHLVTSKNPTALDVLNAALSGVVPFDWSYDYKLATERLAEDLRRGEDRG